MMKKTSNEHVKKLLEDEYFIVAKDGTIGLFGFEKVKELISGKEILKETLVWKTDKPSWERADSIEELCSFFENVPYNN